MINPYESPQAESTAKSNQAILGYTFLTRKWFLIILSLVGSWPLFLFWYVGFSVIIGWREPKGLGDVFAWPIMILMSFLIFMLGWYASAFISSHGRRYAKGLSIFYSCICGFFFLCLLLALDGYMSEVNRSPNYLLLTIELCEFLIKIMLFIGMYYGFIALGHWSLCRYYQRLAKSAHNSKIPK